MLTQVTIRHETAEALKASALWKEIEVYLFDDGPISVIEICAVEDETGETE